MELAWDESQNAGDERSFKSSSSGRSRIDPKSGRKVSSSSYTSSSSSVETRISSSSLHLSVVIVAVVIFNEKNQLLMVQEAKPKCRGKWYLPAGRVEIGEDPFEGAIRECSEEAGLDIQPTGIFCIEYKTLQKRTRRHRTQHRHKRRVRERSDRNKEALEEIESDSEDEVHYNWIRYGVSADVIGGVLKELKDADEESLQAKWIDWNEVCGGMRERGELRNELDVIELVSLWRERKGIPLIPSIRRYHTSKNAGSEQKEKSNV